VWYALDERDVVVCETFAVSLVNLKFLHSQVACPHLFSIVHGFVWLAHIPDANNRYVDEPGKTENH
jgi:hypothetical protein